MRYVLLIYTNEADRPAWGTPEGDAEAKAYEEFHGEVTRRGLQSGSRCCASPRPRACASGTARRRSETAPPCKRPSSSGATTWSMARTLTRRWSWRPRSRAPDTERSRCAPCLSSRSEHPTVVVRPSGRERANHPRPYRKILGVWVGASGRRRAWNRPQGTVAGPWPRRRRRETATAATRTSKPATTAAALGQAADGAVAGAGCGLAGAGAAGAGVAVAAGASGLRLGRPSSISCARRPSKPWYQPPLLVVSRTA